MSEQEVLTPEQEKLIKAYEDYCKRDGHTLYHLPFIIWYKQVYLKKVSK